MTRKLRATLTAMQAAAVLLSVAGAANGTDAGVAAAPKAPSCDKADECAKLAQQYWSGKGAQKNPQVARDLYQAACDKGHALSCSDLANFLSVGMDLQRDERRALELFMRACTLGYVHGCTSAGDMHLQGSRDPGVIPKDNVRAAEMLKKGCDGGEGVACDMLADLYSRGQGVPKNKALARKLRKRATELGFQKE